ncbi:uncharacterized protein LOC132791326 isoform X1 [Drosophila nasuta]|uniref:uncharacterized protein LOC132791326 isoform X1 n=1 Tax=Drosophila nasuta TaxID=42062 RepID=UPI00295F566A|nr:uncharacterized protein LOC132791326 isoform X1 [Drosophila nasuta]
MPWMATLLAALTLRCLVVSVHGGGGGGGGNRFAAYDDLQPPARNSHPKRCNRYMDCAEQSPVVEDSDAELTADNSKMLNALFGLVQSTPAPAHPMEATLTPYQLPAMYYNDFYEDLLTNKRNDVHAAGCDCKVRNDLKDLGSRFYPRYLMIAVCESPMRDAKCTQGSNCKPLEYKVKVLELTTDKTAASSASRLWIAEDMSEPWVWKFKTVTVPAGCFCTN